MSIEHSHFPDLILELYTFLTYFNRSRFPNGRQFTFHTRVTEKVSDCCLTPNEQLNVWRSLFVILYFFFWPLCSVLLRFTDSELTISGWAFFSNAIFFYPAWIKGIIFTLRLSWFVVCRPLTFHIQKQHTNFCLKIVRPSETKGDKNKSTRVVLNRLFHLC